MQQLKTYETPFQNEMATYIVTVNIDEPEDMALAIHVQVPDKTLQILMFDKAELADRWLKYVISFDDTTFDEETSTFTIPRNNVDGWITRILDVSFSNDVENSFTLKHDLNGMYNFYFESTKAMHAWQKEHLQILCRVRIDKSLPVN
jgi:hypothetical protein